MLKHSRVKIEPEFVTKSSQPAIESVLGKHETNLLTAHVKLITGSLKFFDKFYFIQKFASFTKNRNNILTQSLAVIEALAINSDVLITISLCKPKP